MRDTLEREVKIADLGGVSPDACVLPPAGHDAGNAARSPSSSVLVRTSFPIDQGRRPTIWVTTLVALLPQPPDLTPHVSRQIPRFRFCITAFQAGLCCDTSDDSQRQDPCDATRISVGRSEWLRSTRLTILQGSTAQYPGSDPCASLPRYRTV